MRIFLIGFMGSGKSHTGRQLARGAALPFIDLDEWIETREGKSIREIFQDQGEPYFREREREALREMAGFQDVVISCGGGTPCFHGNMRWMNEQGVTIYLRAPAEVLAKRLSNEKEKRPLLKGLEGKELEAFIHSRLSDREAFYMESSIIYEQKAVEEPAAERLLQHFHDLIGH